MSLRKQKHVIIVGGVVVALLAGSVLLGAYAKLAPAKLESNVAAGGCPGCAMVQGAGCGTGLAEGSGVWSSGQVMAAAAPETCPAGRTEPCCAGDPPQDCCGQPCPPDCPKPCCAKQVEAAGCCPVAGGTASK